MRAKHIAWVVAVLLIAASVVSVAWRTPTMSPSKVNSGIEALKVRQGIEYVELEEHHGITFLGGRLERRARDLLHIPQREASMEIVDFRFRDSNGKFTVQYMMAGDRLKYVEVYTDLDSASPSTATMEFLKQTFPGARFSKCHLR